MLKAQKASRFLSYIRHPVILGLLGDDLHSGSLQSLDDALFLIVDDAGAYEDTVICKVGRNISCDLRDNVSYYICDDKVIRSMLYALELASVAFDIVLESDNSMRTQDVLRCRT